MIPARIIKPRTTESPPHNLTVSPHAIHASTAPTNPRSSEAVFVHAPANALPLSIGTTCDRPGKTRVCRFDESESLRRGLGKSRQLPFLALTHSLSETTQGAPTLEEQTRPSSFTPPPQQASLPVKLSPPSLPLQPTPAENKNTSRVMPRLLSRKMLKL